MKTEKTRRTVLVCEPIADIGIEMLREHFEVEVRTESGPTAMTQPEQLAGIEVCDGVIIGGSTRIDADTFNRAQNLMVIGRTGAGFANIDVAAAEARGIKLVDSPDAVSLAVAGHTLALILSVARRIPYADSSMKKGVWEPKHFMGTGLAGRTLGIIGCGRVGSLVAVRAVAFGMKVVVYQRRPNSEQHRSLGVEAVELDELLQIADFVSLHVPRDEATESLIDTAALARMRPGAYLINTACGSLVDETALLNALNEGRIAGAALDVFRNEPQIDWQLATHPKVIATPHIAASTDDARESAAVTVAEQLIEILREPEFHNPLSLEVVPLDRVFPHEHTDPRRVERLRKRVDKAEVFTNPPIVVRHKDKYVVLDGATRVTALKELKFKDIIVQVIADEDEYALDTWYHAIRQIALPDLLQVLKRLPEIELVETDAEEVLAKLADYGGLCYIHTVEDKIFHIEPAAGVNHLDALNKLTETYIDASYVTRTTERDMDQLVKEYPDVAALVVFPVFELGQILQITQANRAVPAGITRFLIPGRVMRLNADMAYLRSAAPLLAKRAWLHDLVMDKLARDRVRYYAEPIYLMDE